MAARSAVAAALRQSVARAAGDAAAAGSADAVLLRSAALGRVDVALAQTAALLRSTAGWIDAHPDADARSLAVRVRLSADATARCVLDEVGRALGPAPFCRDRELARRFADLPIFIRQSGADRDAIGLGSWLASFDQEDPWRL